MTDLKRIILEIGTGNDLYGEDYTKAATARSKMPSIIAASSCSEVSAWIRHR